MQSSEFTQRFAVEDSASLDKHVDAIIEAIYPGVTTPRVGFGLPVPIVVVTQVLYNYVLTHQEELVKWGVQGLAYILAKLVNKIPA